MGHRREEGRGSPEDTGAGKMEGRLEARPGGGEEKVERKTQQNCQCLDGLSRVIEKACLGPNMKAMFLQVLKGKKTLILFSGWGKGIESDREGYFRR